MKIIGQKVKHQTFGLGTVESINGEILTVRFSSTSKRFLYPSAFTQFLVAADESVNTEIQEAIARQQQALVREHETASTASQSSQDSSSNSDQTTPHNDSPHTSHIVCRTREDVLSDEEGSRKRQTFYVFQGRTYQQESRGGYIWAPISASNGLSFHHWKRLLDVHLGDVIYHGYQAKIVAISVAKGECYDALQPAELEDYWDREGRRVDCEYYTLKNPFATARLRSEIIRLCQIKNAPFNRFGNGNVGYLFSLNRELAKLFLKGILAENENLRQVEEILEVSGG